MLHRHFVSQYMSRQGNCYIHTYMPFKYTQYFLEHMSPDTFSQVGEVHTQFDRYSITAPNGTHTTSRYTGDTYFTVPLIHTIHIYYNCRTFSLFNEQKNRYRLKNCTKLCATQKSKINQESVSYW